MLPYKSILKIGRNDQLPVYLQIVNGIIGEIHKGVLKPGQLLPGSRTMSELIDVNRKTVIMAYDELMSQGWIQIIPYKGTYVSANLPDVKTKPFDESVANNKSKHVEAGFPYKINQLLPVNVYNEKQFLEIDEGSPDERLAPVNELYKKCRSIANSKGGINLLKYHDVYGEKNLRTVLANYLSNTRGVNCEINNIMITRGSQMAIFLILQTLLQPNDNVIVGESNYQSANLVISYAKANIVTVPVDEYGIDTDALAAICKQKTIKAIYITPHHHFPTTVTLSAKRRIALLALAKEHRFMILEDDYDYDFHYSSTSILPLASHDPFGVVLYVGGFSKLLAPAIRIGYLVGPSAFVREIAKFRKIIDRQGDPIMEKALAEMIEEGAIARHLKKSVRLYQHRRDLFCDMLRKQIGEFVEFTIPEGGMVVWTIFKPYIDMQILSTQMMAMKIKINPERDFVKKYNAIRFGFASLNDEEIAKTINALKTVLSKMEHEKDI